MSTWVLRGFLCALKFAEGVSFPSLLSEGTSSAAVDAVVTCEGLPVACVIDYVGGVEASWARERLSYSY